jgi:hypothetical protein
MLVAVPRSTKNGLSAEYGPHGFDQRSKCAEYVANVNISMTLELVP